MLEVMKALAAAIDAKDPYTEGHSKNVRYLSLRTGKRMGLSKIELKDLEIAALLHDIGKIGIPDIILSKPGRFNMAEKITISVHPTIGAQILKQINGMETVSLGVLDHHEHFDGEGGYPNNIK